MSSDSRGGQQAPPGHPGPEGLAAPQRPARPASLTEGLTMALYLSLVIGAEFVAVDGHLSDKIDALGVVWGTAIGLTLAHVFAFNLANLVFARTTPADPRREAIVYQVLAAAIVAGALSIPILVLQLSGALTVDRFILAGFVGVTGWHVSRSAGASDVHALAAGLLMMALGLIVIGVKAALSSH